MRRIQSSGMNVAAYQLQTSTIFGSMLQSYTKFYQHVKSVHIFREFFHQIVLIIDDVSYFINEAKTYIKRFINNNCISEIRVIIISDSEKKFSRLR